MLQDICLFLIEFLNCEARAAGKFYHIYAILSLFRSFLISKSTNYQFSNRVCRLEKSATRNAFSLKEMAIFFKISFSSFSRESFVRCAQKKIFKIAPTYFHRGNEREEHSLSNNCHIVPLENSLYR